MFKKFGSYLAHHLLTLAGEFAEFAGAKEDGYSFVKYIAFCEATNRKCTVDEYNCVIEIFRLLHREGIA